MLNMQLVIEEYISNSVEMHTCLMKPSLIFAWHVFLMTLWIHCTKAYKAELCVFPLKWWLLILHFYISSFILKFKLYHCSDSTFQINVCVWIFPFCAFSYCFCHYPLPAWHRLESLVKNETQLKNVVYQVVQGSRPWKNSVWWLGPLQMAPHGGRGTVDIQEFLLSMSQATLGNQENSSMVFALNPCLEFLSRALSKMHYD